jgi:hypothetical protein
MALLQKLAQVHRKGINNTNLIVCHHCKELITREYVRCSRFGMTPFDGGCQHSPTAYYHRLVAFDYCYEADAAPSLEDMLNYYIYSQCPNLQRQCNRLFCHNCLNQSSSALKEKDLKNYKCNFCRKVCQCEGCLTANQLIRNLAIIFDLIKRNCQPEDAYNELIDFVNFSEEQFPRQRFLRCGFRNVEKEVFIEHYHKEMEQFEKIHEAKQLAGQSRFLCIALTPETEFACALIEEQKCNRKVQPPPILDVMKRSNK